MPDYEWITSEMFTEKLGDIVAAMSSDEILAVPGTYEALSEALNNEVLDALESERQDNA